MLIFIRLKIFKYIHHTIPFLFIRLEVQLLYPPTIFQPVCKINAKANPCSYIYQNLLYLQKLCLQF
jgi:hypothetical protein